MSFIELPHRSLEIYYETYGDPSHHPLVLINGLKSDHTGFGSMTEKLATKYHVLIFDNRSIGQTKDDGVSFTIETLADDTIALIDALKWHRPHIFGHSMGGAIVQTIAKKYLPKIHKMGLFNTFIKFNTKAEKAFKHVITLYQQGASQSKIMEFVIPWVFAPSFITPELQGLVYKMSDENPFKQSMEDYKRQFNALIQFDSHVWLPSLMDKAKDILIIGSRQDITATLTESQELHEKIPGSHLDILEGGHASAIEEPEAFLKLIYRFLDEK